MGKLDVVPVLGYDLPRYMPTILILVVVFNIFNIYGKIMRFFGFSVFDYSENSDDKKVKDGKGTVDSRKEKIYLKLESGFLASKSKNLISARESETQNISLISGESDEDDEYRLFDSFVERKSTDF